MSTEVETLAQWLDREASFRGPTGYLTNASFSHFLLKFATALRDIEASAIEARSDGTPKSGPAEGLQPDPKGDVQSMETPK